MNYRIATWDSDSHEQLKKMVNDFLIENDVEVIDTSFSTIWDPKKERIIFSVCVAYMFEE